MPQIIPAQVQARADLADELWKAEAKTADGQDPSTVQAPAGPEDRTQDANLQPDASQANAQPAKDADPNEDWKHKYQVLLGKYNAEVEAIKGDHNLLNTLRAQNADLRKQLHASEQQVQELKASQQQQPEEHAENSLMSDLKARLSKDEMDILHDEGLTSRTLSIMAKLFQSPKNPEPQADNKVQTSSPKPNPQDAAEFSPENFAAFAKSVPDYMAIDGDPGFISYLRLPLINAGILRIYPEAKTVQDALVAAQTNQDVVTAVQIFRGYKQQVQAQAQQQQQPQPQPQVDPKKNIDPTSSAASPPPAQQPSGKIVPLTEIQAFHREMARLVPRQPGGKMTEIQIKQEAEYMKALDEGRVDRTK